MCGVVNLRIQADDLETLKELQYYFQLRLLPFVCSLVLRGGGTNQHRERSAISSLNRFHLIQYCPKAIAWKE